MIAGIINPDLKKYKGEMVSEMAAAEKKPELDALFDFILADQAQNGALYFMASEQDLAIWLETALDFDRLGRKPFDHPRAFGSMARFLGYYVRDQKLMPMEEAIRKITSMPAHREHLDGRGLINVGFYADITVFDPAAIIDEATYQDPNKLSNGVDCVLVNGQVEFEHGALTGVKAGRALRGQGWTGR